MFIELLIVLFDLAFTSLITGLIIPVGKGYHYWVPFLLSVAGYVIGLALIWLMLTVFALPYDKNKKYEKPSKWASFWLREAITYIDYHAGVRVKINNDIDLPSERYLLVCNHRSKFDPMILCQLYGNQDLAFISKPTNFKIPLGGHFMKASCYLPIDRYDKLKSLEVMNEAIELINQKNASIGVFPEGTRSEDCSLGNFHEGVFNIAKRTNCPIVITSISGTENIHKNFPKKRTRVELNILEIMYPTDYSDMVAKDISNHAYELIKNSLSE